ncbi:MAG: hypothetical protein F4X31_12280 [Gammaproteobacteria bacterium]|nr:hypothetical protein [Gammaproteobacteria bacterium]
MKADDFARGAVAGSAEATGLHLGLIIVGGTIGFAVFVISSQIGGALGYAKAGLAFAIGSLILGFMGAVTSYVGAKSRLSTYLLTEFAFGPTGAKVANLVVALSLVGWFGVICNTLGLATQEMLRDSWNIDVPPAVVITAASALMISVTAAGFTGIDRLALFLTPFMALLIGYAAFLALRADSGEPLAVEQAFTFQTAVSAVVGTYIVGVIIQPDYSRFAVNVRHAVWSVFIALALFFPLVQFFSAVPSMATGEPSVVLVMSGLGIILPAFFLLFLGAWSSNVLCLYSSSLSVATLMERARLSHIIIAIGVAGTALAYVMVQEAIVDYLVLLGITVPPIGAIYIVEAIFVRRFRMDLEELDGEPGFNIRAFGAWAGAIAVGYCSDQELMGIVGIASIDSLIVASALYTALQWRHWLSAAERSA